MLWAHVQEAPPPVTSTRAELPAAVDEVVARSMAKSPDDRYQSCRALVADLRAALTVGVSAAKDLTVVRSRDSMSRAPAHKVLAQRRQEGGRQNAKRAPMRDRRRLFEDPYRERPARGGTTSGRSDRGDRETRGWSLPSWPHSRWSWARARLVARGRVLVRRRAGLEHGRRGSTRSSCSITFPRSIRTREILWSRRRLPSERLCYPATCSQSACSAEMTAATRWCGRTAKLAARGRVEPPGQRRPGGLVAQGIGPVLIPLVSPEGDEDGSVH